jgi:hypothetical protein
MTQHQGARGAAPEPTGECSLARQSFRRALATTLTHSAICYSFILGMFAVLTVEVSIQVMFCSRCPSQLHIASTSCSLVKTRQGAAGMQRGK